MEILTSEDLLKRQLKELSAETSAKSKGIESAKSDGISYNAELQRMIRAIKKDINELIIPEVRYLSPEYTADGWLDTITEKIALLRQRWSSELFNQFANETASSFVQAANLRNYTQVEKEMKRFGINVFESNETLSEYVSASAYDNSRLIKSIKEQYLDQVESIVTTNMRAGQRPSAITKLISNQFGVSERRAKVIARDQTSKINADLTEKRMRASGVKYFQWVTSKDARVRDRHDAIANKVTKYGKGIYAWDDLPLSDKGVPISPGKDYQCRCIARPVLQSEVDRNIKQGLTNPKVSK